MPIRTSCKKEALLATNLLAYISAETIYGIQPMKLGAILPAHEMYCDSWATCVWTYATRLENINVLNNTTWNMLRLTPSSADNNNNNNDNNK